MYDWISYVGNKLNQSRETIQGAVILFDRLVIKINNW